MVLFSKLIPTPVRKLMYHHDSETKPPPSSLQNCYSPVWPYLCADYVKMKPISHFQSPRITHRTQVTIHQFLCGLILKKPGAAALDVEDGIINDVSK